MSIVNSAPQTDRDDLSDLELGLREQVQSGTSEAFAASRELSSPACQQSGTGIARIRLVLRRTG